MHVHIACKCRFCSLVAFEALTESLYPSFGGSPLLGEFYQPVLCDCAIMEARFPTLIAACILTMSEVVNDMQTWSHCQHVTYMIIERLHLMSLAVKHLQHPPLHS